MATIGNIKRVSAVFTVGATETDPTALTVRVRAPDGTETAYFYLTDAEVVRTAAGRFRFDLTGEQAGEYIVRFEGTGAATAADNEKIKFTASGFSS